jgi:hypothetical protein
MGKFSVNGPFPRDTGICLCTVYVCGGDKRSGDVLVWFGSEKTENFSGVFYCVCSSSYLFITAAFHMR